MKTNLLIIFTFFFLGSNAQYQHEWVRGIKHSTAYTFLDAATSPDSSIVIAGSFIDTLVFELLSDTIVLTSQPRKNASFIAKLSHDGQYLWALKLGDNHAEYTMIEGLDVSNQGDIQVAFYAEGESIDLDPSQGEYVIQGDSVFPFYPHNYIASYSSKGQIQWARPLFSNSLGTIEQLNQTSSGDIYMFGRMKNSIDFDPSSATHLIEATIQEYANYILVLNSLGEFKSAWKSFAFSFHPASSGKFYTFGSFSRLIDLDLRPNHQYLLFSVRNSYANYLACNNSDGSVLWARSFQNSEVSTIRDIIVNSDESIFFGGFRDLNSFNIPNTIFGDHDMVFGKIDAQGNIQFTITMGGWFEDEIYELERGYANDIFCYGRFDDSIDIDPGPGFQIIKGNGVPDSKLILQFDAQGIVKSHLQPEDWNKFYQYNLIRGLDGGLYTYGNLYDSSIDFDFGPGIDTLSAELQMGFIQKISLGSLNVSELQPPTEVNIYPNPSENYFNLISKENIEKVSIYRQSGELVRKINFSHNSQSRFSIDSSPGLYLIKIQMANGFGTWRKVIKR